MLAHEMGIDIWGGDGRGGQEAVQLRGVPLRHRPGRTWIPVNPYYISWKAREFDFHTSFIELAGDINLRMANYVMHRIHSFTTRLGIKLAGARVLCLGAAFKAGVRDFRNSPAIRAMELLHDEGAHVSFADPLVDTLTIGGLVHEGVCLEPRALEGYDFVVAFVRNAAWPTDAILASGIPTFNAVNALGCPESATHERR